MTCLHDYLFNVERCEFISYFPAAALSQFAFWEKLWLWPWLQGKICHSSAATEETKVFITVSSILFSSCWPFVQQVLVPFGSSLLSALYSLARCLNILIITDLSFPKFSLIDLQTEADWQTAGSPCDLDIALVHIVVLIRLWLIVLL